MLKYQLCPEWETQQGVLLTWPHRHSSWNEDLHNIEKCYQEITLHITRFEPVHILCYDTGLRDNVRQRLTNIGIPEQRLHFHVIATNDTWIRDYGPLRIKRGNEYFYQRFQFNGWGDKYPHALDNKAGDELFRCPPFSLQQHATIDFVLEGGSIDANGHGSLLTTTSCLLNQNRNPGYDKLRIETLLNQHLGIDDIIWIDAGALNGDDTDGHVDTLARFCNADTIIYHESTPQSDHVYRSLNQHRAQRNLDPYNLVPCPLPAGYGSKYALPASYVNFLIINGAVLVPTYADRQDREALSIMADLFPHHEVIGIDCRALIHQYGSLHCATMQF